MLLNPDTRQVYDRLGDAGVKVTAHSVIDHKYIIIQMLVYYSSSVIFAFLMTFAESSGDAMVTSLFGLIGESRPPFFRSCEGFHLADTPALVAFVVSVSSYAVDR